MSDSEDSTVTYTEVSSPFEDLSDIGSPRVVGPEYEGLHLEGSAFQAPPFPDYVPGPEYPPSPDFILELVYLAEEQPLPAALSPTTDSPGYDESSDDDEDDDVDIEEDEEEEEHLAPANFIAVALPAVDQAPFAEETKPFKSDEFTATPAPHPAYRITARMSIRDDPPTPFWFEEEVSRLLAIPTPPPSPLSPWYEVGESSSTAAARLTKGSRADYGFVSTMDKEIRRDLERYVGYGITDTWDEMLEDMPAAPATDDTELGRRMTEFSTRVRQDTDEIYTRLVTMYSVIGVRGSDYQSCKQWYCRRQAVDYRVAGSGIHMRQAQFIEHKAAEETLDPDDRVESQQGPAKGLAYPDAQEETGSSS
ncbi:hypothetical protein Tco_0064624 [Tanacetum coccineum]